MFARRPIALVVTALLAPLGACAPASRAAAPPARSAAPPVPQTARDEPQTVKLELVAFTVLSGAETLAAVGRSRFGGLSGCVARSSGNRLLAISDERTAPRFFILSIELGMGLRVEPTSAVRLALSSTERAAPSMLDAEGITLLDDTRVIVSSEGDRRHRPGIFEYDLLGRFVRALPIPGKYLPDGGRTPTRGVRENLAFEALTSLPDGRVYSGIEAPLIQDDDPPTTSRGAWSRLIEFVPAGRGWRAAREFAYPLDPIPPAPALAQPSGLSGLVDMVPLATDRFLTLERSYVMDRAKNGRSANGVRIFEASLEGADDISGVESLRRAAAVGGIHKTLVLDLGEIAPQLGPRLKTLENFEGLCYGPTLPDRSRSLLLVADDNFNQQQRTAFVLLRLVPRATPVAHVARRAGQSSAEDRWGRTASISAISSADRR